MMRRSPLKRLSEKKLAAHGGRVPRSTLSAQPVKRRKRKPSETLRIYGGKKRIEFVKSLPCSACGIRGYSQNAHVLGNDGMGRKRDAATIAPLCGPHPKDSDSLNGFTFGCHAMFDQYRSMFDARYPRFKPWLAAAETQAAWAANQGADRT